ELLMCVRLASYAEKAEALGGLGGQGSGFPSALRTVSLGGLGGQGSGFPSAVSIVSLGGLGGQGSGFPSAHEGLLTLDLPLLHAGSRMNNAREKRTAEIASFLTDEPSSRGTMRVLGGAREASVKMF